MVQELDMPEENIATLICHLEAHPAQWIMEVGTKVCSFTSRMITKNKKKTKNE